jgi:hypothetical protein
MCEGVYADGIALSTRENWPIPNEVVDETNAVSLQEGRALITAGHPERTVRSLSGRYNCIGLVVASRRALVLPRHLRRILKDDGYHQIARDQVKTGDLVLYMMGKSIEHIAVVEHISVKDGDIWVISQWGRNGEYRHRINDVFEVYGEPTEFWTHRRELAR